MYFAMPLCDVEDFGNDSFDCAHSIKTWRVQMSLYDLPTDTFDIYTVPSTQLCLLVAAF